MLVSVICEVITVSFIYSLRGSAIYFSLLILSRKCTVRFGLRAHGAFVHICSLHCNTWDFV